MIKSIALSTALLAGLATASQGFANDQFTVKICNQTDYTAAIAVHEAAGMNQVDVSQLNSRLSRQPNPCLVALVHDYSTKNGGKLWLDLKVHGLTPSTAILYTDSKGRPHDPSAGKLHYNAQGAVWTLVVKN